MEDTQAQERFVVRFCEDFIKRLPKGYASMVELAEAFTSSDHPPMSQAVFLKNLKKIVADPDAPIKKEISPDQKNLYMINESAVAKDVIKSETAPEKVEDSSSAALGLLSMFGIPSSAPTAPLSDTPISAEPTTKEAPPSTTQTPIETAAENTTTSVPTEDVPTTPQKSEPSTQSGALSSPGSASRDPRMKLKSAKKESSPTTDSAILPTLTTPPTQVPFEASMVLDLQEIVLVPSGIEPAPVGSSSSPLEPNSTETNHSTTEGGKSNSSESEQTEQPPKAGDALAAVESVNTSAAALEKDVEMQPVSENAQDKLATKEQSAMVLDLEHSSSTPTSQNTDSTKVEGSVAPSPSEPPSASVSTPMEVQTSQPSDHQLMDTREDHGKPASTSTVEIAPSSSELSADMDGSSDRDPRKQSKRKGGRRSSSSKTSANEQQGKVPQQDEKTKAGGNDAAAAAAASKGAPEDKEKRVTSDFLSALLSLGLPGDQPDQKQSQSTPSKPLLPLPPTLTNRPAPTDFSVALQQFCAGQGIVLPGNPKTPSVAASAMKISAPPSLELSVKSGTVVAAASATPTNAGTASHRIVGATSPPPPEIEQLLSLRQAVVGNAEEDISEDDDEDFDDGDGELGGMALVSLSSAAQLDGADGDKRRRRGGRGGRRAAVEKKLPKVQIVEEPIVPIPYSQAEVESSPDLTWRLAAWITLLRDGPMSLYELHKRIVLRNLVKNPGAGIGAKSAAKGGAQDDSDKARYQRSWVSFQKCIQKEKTKPQQRIEEDPMRGALFVVVDSMAYLLDPFSVQLAVIQPGDEVDSPILAQADTKSEDEEYVDSSSGEEVYRPRSRRGDPSASATPTSTLPSLGKRQPTGSGEVPPPLPVSKRIKLDLGPDAMRKPYDPMEYNLPKVKYPKKRHLIAQVLLERTKPGQDEPVKMDRYEVVDELTKRGCISGATPRPGRAHGDSTAPVRHCMNGDARRGEFSAFCEEVGEKQSKKLWLRDTSRWTPDPTIFVRSKQLGGSDD